MGKIRKEKSILGQITNLSHKLVLMLVVPIIISLILMLFYAAKYHNSIDRMETVASLKTVVTEEIPEGAWNIVSGRQTFSESRIYATIGKVNDTLDSLAEQTSEENRLSLVVAGRTMKTLENYVDRIRDNIDEGELLDNVIEYYGRINIDDSDFEALIEEIIEAGR